MWCERSILLSGVGVMVAMMIRAPLLAVPVPSVTRKIAACAPVAGGPAYARARAVLRHLAALVPIARAIRAVVPRAVPRPSLVRARITLTVVAAPLPTPFIRA